MSGFSADWLTLREPVDRRARNAEIRDAVVRALRPRVARAILDLGCGTGSTLRAMAPHLPSPQDWRLVDRDAALLARAAALTSSPSRRIETRIFDFSATIEPVLTGIDIVMASALFDLVSEPWLAAFVRALAVRRLPAYVALSYNGVMALDPAEPEDAAVFAAFNAHQNTDKGFGAALGPDAAARAMALFAAAGYRLLSGPSDWLAGAEDRAFQQMLLSGCAEAAAAVRPEEGGMIAAWRARRLAASAAGRLRIRVGHIDFLAVPPALAA